MAGTGENCTGWVEVNKPVFEEDTSHPSGLQSDFLPPKISSRPPDSRGKVEGTNGFVLLQKHRAGKPRQIKSVAQGHPTFQVAKSSCETWKCPFSQQISLRLPWLLATCLQFSWLWMGGEWWKKNKVNKNQTHPDPEGMDRPKETVY